MIVTGLNSNRFLIGNKIPVTIKLDNSENFEVGSVIIINITKLVTHSGDVQVTLPSIRLFPNKDSLVFDLSDYIKGLMPYAYTPNNSYQNPIPNYQRFNITIHENQKNTSEVFLNKTFIRGFKRLYSNSAFTLSVNETLCPSDKIPYWNGYPFARFYIDGNSTIQVQEVVDPQYTKQMRPSTSCDPFYVRFLNSKGGYSFWLFNAWDLNTKSSSKGLVNKVLSRDSLGFSEENTVNVDTRVKREFFPLMQDLIVSPMVQVYNKFGTDNWVKIDLKNSSYTENNYEDLIEFSCSFDLNLGNKPEVIW